MQSQDAQTAGAATEEVIDSANWRGGELLAGKIREKFAVEWNANESLHCAGHYKHVRDASLEWLEHVLERVHVNCVGQGSAHA